MEREIPRACPLDCPDGYAVAAPAGAAERAHERFKVIHSDSGS